MKDLTAERLRELLHYDPETGAFTRIVRTSNVIKVGDFAGWKRPDGYRVITVEGKQHRAHRLAWLYVNGRWPVEEIDHINGIRDDNRIANLREATRVENAQNLPEAHSDSATGLLGVHFNKRAGRWGAQIRVDGKRRWLGNHATPQLAHAAYVKAKAELHPFSTITEAST